MPVKRECSDKARAKDLGVRWQPLVCRTSWKSRRLSALSFWAGLAAGLVTSADTHTWPHIQKGLTLGA